MKEILAGFGDSAVVAGSEKMRRIHVHTNTPALLFERLRHTGTITFQKADDMIRQSQAVYDRKYRIALVTDSTCDLSQELIDRYQVYMLPININFGDNHYLDKVTLNPEQFYRLLDESPDYPKSSQVNEISFINLYSHLASHYDSVIAINLSDKLSGTYNSSMRAAKTVSAEFNKPITVLNSKNLSGSIGLLVLRAAKAIESGASHDEVVKMIEKWIPQTRILVSVKTLKYLVRGGRLSRSKGLIAKLLNVNPIVSVDSSGKAITSGKAFSHKANMDKIIATVRKETAGKKIWNYIVLHAGNEEAAAWYSEQMEKITGLKPASVCNISPVIGANVGLGSSAIAYITE